MKTMRKADLAEKKIYTASSVDTDVFVEIKDRDVSIIRLTQQDFNLHIDLLLDEEDHQQADMNTVISGFRVIQVGKNNKRVCDSAVRRSNGGEKWCVPIHSECKYVIICNTEEEFWVRVFYLPDKK